MNAPAYHLVEAENISTLKAMRRSPLHYLEAKANARRTTAAMGKGLSAHMLILEPHRLDEVTVCDMSRDTRAWELYEAVRASGEVPAVYDGAVRRGKSWEAFAAEHDGQLMALASEWEAVQPLLKARTIMTSAELAAAREMADAVHAHPEALRLLQGGQAEVPIYWTDEETGIDCKGRADYVSANALVDLKTTMDVSPQAFGRQCARMLTHLQLAFYRDGLLATGRRTERVYLVAVESVRPYDVAVYHVDRETLDVGQDEYRKLLRRLAECVESDTWPGVAPGIVDLVLPSWSMAGDDNEPEVELTMGGQKLTF